MPNNRSVSVLIVDDDRVFCDAATEALQGGRIEISAAYTGAVALEVCANRRVDIVILDQGLPDGSGHKLCSGILHCNDRTKIIFVTAFPRFEQAVAAVQGGVSDFLYKPFELEELRLAVNRAVQVLDLERNAELLSYREEQERKSNVLVGKSLEEVRRLVELAAGADAPVFITGETGTGKNLIARAIHDAGANAEHPFLYINCAALPEDLVEAELFGYEKGAFTGATASRSGIFEMAEGGTLLLDEIGEMPLHLQSKLLGVLETKEVKRLGGNTIRPFQVRIIAATNAPVNPFSSTRIRQDLYFRLSVIQIHAPPLRERIEDMHVLCEHLLERIDRGRTAVLDAEEVARLSAYSWPGNIRELNNVLERSVILAESGVLQPSRFLPRMPSEEMLFGKTDGKGVIRASGNCEKAEPGGRVTAKKVTMGGAGWEVPGEGIPTLQEMEKKHIVCVLNLLSFNLVRTAAALGISRSTLKRKMVLFKIVPAEALGSLSGTDDSY